MSEKNQRPQIILHGGAVTDRDYWNANAMEFLRDCCSRAFQRLQDGWAAARTAAFAVHEMELSGLFLAGKGACPNANGQFELDASIMSGEDVTGGGVAGVVGARCAISLADRARVAGHTLMLGYGARSAFPDDEAWLLEPPEDYFVPLDVSEAAKKSGLSTVGAAVFDAHGNCAAATATGGVIGKMPGRVGDTAIIGAGTWADKTVAVSCTGQGEYFVRSVAAKGVASRIHYAKMSLEEATQHAIADVGAIGGLGGIVAASSGGVTWAYNTSGLKRAWVDPSGEVQLSV